MTFVLSLRSHPAQDSGHNQAYAAAAAIRPLPSCQAASLFSLDPSCGTQPAGKGLFLVRRGFFLSLSFFLWLAWINGGSDGTKTLHILSSSSFGGHSHECGSLMAQLCVCVVCWSEFNEAPLSAAAAAFLLCVWANETDCCFPRRLWVGVLLCY